MDVCPAVPDPELDDLAALAAAVCDAPFAAVVLKGGGTYRHGPRPDNEGSLLEIDIAAGDTRFGVLRVAGCPSPARRTALERLARQGAALLAARARARLWQDVFDRAAVDLVLIEVMPDGALIYRDLNAVHAANSGFDRQTFAGRTMEDLFDADAAPIARARFEACVRNGQAIEYEVTARFPSGERVRRSWLSPLRDATGRVAHILLTSLDLTETRRVEAQLRQSQKMDAIGQMTGGLAHDFNNLLTVIMGSLDRLDSRLTDESLRRSVANALEATRKGASLTRQLLAVARRQTLEVTAIDVNGVIAPMVDLLERTLGRAIAITTALEPEIWRALGDGGQLEHMLLNLALNARDAMPAGGTLEIETRNETLAVADRMLGLQAGAYVRIRVSDSGEGMPPEVLDRAAEPFFTTKQEGRGSGLGLAQVYGLMTQFGGAMAIDSAPGRGTRVDLYLRRAP